MVCHEISIMNAAPPVACVRRSSFLGVRMWCLLVWATAVCAAVAAEVPPAQITESQSRFHRILGHLQDASPELRSEFATIALTHLAVAYSEEARLARAEAGGKDAGLWAWSAAVDRFARQVPLLLEDIELGWPVSLASGGEDTLAVTVGDRVVIVNHPRLNQQHVFEQEILVDFCSRQNCEQFIPGDSRPEPIPVSTRKVRPDWMFTKQGWACSYRGIKVWFNSEQNMAKSRLICEQFLQELMMLTDEIAWQHRHSVPIAWDELDIQSTPQRPEHVVRLNAAGDSVLLTVPVLYRSPELLVHVIPWVRQRVTNQQDVSVELDAGRYGWQTP